MKITSHPLLIGTILSCAVAVGLGARQDQSQASSQTRNATVTVEGCLVRNSATADASSSTSRAMEAMYKLTSVDYKSGGATVDKVTGSTTRPTELSVEPSTTVTTKVDLANLVNQKVEITGTVSTDGTSSMSSSSTASSSAASRAMNGPTLKATSAKSVAKTCTQ